MELSVRQCYVVGASERIAGSRVLGILVEELLSLVDLGGQVRAPTAVGVIQQHELTVLLAHLLLIQASFPLSRSVSPGLSHMSNLFAEVRTEVQGSRRLHDESCVVQILCIQCQEASFRAWISHEPFVEGPACSIHSTFRAAIGDQTGTALNQSVSNQHTLTYSKTTHQESGNTNSKTNSKSRSHGEKGNSGREKPSGSGSLKIEATGIKVSAGDLIRFSATPLRRPKLQKKLPVNNIKPKPTQPATMR